MKKKDILVKKNIKDWENFTKNLESITNKDEHIFDTENKIIAPMQSMVMWPFSHMVEGGYLEITKVSEKDIVDEKSTPYKSFDKFRCRKCDRSFEKFPIERIEPKFNRIAIFDGSYLHRVSPIEKGDRWTFAVDVWDREISMTKKGTY